MRGNRIYLDKLPPSLPAWTGNVSGHCGYITTQRLSLIGLTPVMCSGVTDDSDEWTAVVAGR